MFGDGELSDDQFLCGRLRLLQPLRGYRAANDAVFLAAACPARAGQKVLDLGCGAGAAALCLGVRLGDVALAGVELQANYADLARRNGARNGLAFEVHHGDLAQMPAPLRIGFDHVIANPPYYPAGGTPSPIKERAAAMQIHPCLGLADWLFAASKRLVPGGWLTLICQSGALGEVLSGAQEKGLGSAVILPLSPREGREATRVILRLRKGGRGALRLLAPLVIHPGAEHQDGPKHHTPLAHAVLCRAASLSELFD